MRRLGGATAAIVLSATAAFAEIPIPTIDATEATTGFSGGSVPPQQQAQVQQPPAITVESASPYIEVGGKLHQRGGRGDHGIVAQLRHRAGGHRRGGLRLWQWLARRIRARLPQQPGV
jgi:hypothetical protein